MVPTFPAELIREVPKNLELAAASLAAAEPDKDTFPTFLACVMVSKDFFHEAQPLVYSRIDITEKVAPSRSTNKRLHLLARTLRSNPDLAKYVHSFNLKLSATGSGVRLPNQSSTALAFVLPLFSKLVTLSFRVTQGLRCYWPEFPPALQEAIAHAFGGNRGTLTSVRLAKFGIPAALWLKLPNLVSIHLQRNPVPLICGKNFLGFDSDPDHPDIEQRDMARDIKARVLEFECIDDPLMVAQVSHDAPQALAQTTTMSIRCRTWMTLKPVATSEDFWMLPVPLSSISRWSSLFGGVNPEPIDTPHMQRLKTLETRWEYASDSYLRSFLIPFAISAVGRAHATLEQVHISIVRPHSMFSGTEALLRREVNDALRRITPRPLRFRSLTFSVVDE